MLHAKYIEKFRDSKGRIFGYRLVDLNGQTQDVESEKLKLAINNGQIHVVNLKLTADNRLIDSDEKQLKDTDTLEQIGRESFYAKCVRLDINPNSARQLRFKHPELSDMQILKYYLQKPTRTFADKCREANVNHNNARQYKYKHPELSEEQVIMYLVSKR